MFDLNLVSLNFVGGQEQAEMPGLFGATSPRRAARGRTQEQLVLFLTLQGNAPFTPISMRQLLERLAQTYFDAPGSVTTALHSIIEMMNSNLLERNLHNASIGRQAMGSLSLAVFHGNYLYLAQSGAAHAYLIGQTPAQHFNDPQIATHGLGLTSTPAVRYYQAELAAAQYLAFCDTSPTSWSAAALGSSPAGSLEAMRRRLLNQAPANLTAALVQITPGSGKVNQVTPVIKPTEVSPVGEVQRIRPTGTTPENETAPLISPYPVDAALVLPPVQNIPAPEKIGPVPAATKNPPAAGVETPPVKLPPAQPQPVQPSTQKPTNVPTPAGSPADRTPSRYTYSRSSRSQPGGTIRPISNPEDEPVIQEIQRRQRTSAFLQSVGGFLSGARAFRQRAAHATNTFLARMIPGSSEKLPPLSNATMVFLAIAVPVIVVTAAIVVYNAKGRSDYYHLYYAQAQLSASQAASMKDDKPQADEAVHSAWKEALAELDKAETYQRTTEAQVLRQQIWDALDKLDGVERLDFKPITSTGLGQNVQISRIVASGNELFMLDSTQGRLLYGIQTGHGYDIDPSFNCLPGGKTGQSQSNRLIDVTALPVDNTFKASVAAVDEAGNFIYCKLGEAPTYFQLAPPDSGWGQITAITLDSHVFYVLDARGDQIYYYELDAKGDYRDPPSKLFADPPKLDDSIDLAVNGNHVYILHRDGHLTDCTVYGATTTHCTSPAVFNEFRPNKPQSPTSFPGTNFTHILYTPPPDPSIYILDANAATLYLFSVQLNLRRLFTAPLEVISSQNDPQATAFTINKSNRTAFLAWGNQVYYAYVP